MSPSLSLLPPMLLPGLASTGSTESRPEVRECSPVLQPPGPGNPPLCSCVLSLSQRNPTYFSDSSKSSQLSSSTTASLGLKHPRENNVAMGLMYGGNHSLQPGNACRLSKRPELPLSPLPRVLRGKPGALCCTYTRTTFHAELPRSLQGSIWVLDLPKLAGIAISLRPIISKSQP